MAFNNTVTLIGNIGNEAKIIEDETGTFAVLSIATTDSYQDENGDWHDKETVWHKILAFSPKVIQELKSYKKGTRLKIIGSLSYRPFEVIDGENTYTKYEASIIAGKVEQAALTKKNAA